MHINFDLHFSFFRFASNDEIHYWKKKTGREGEEIEEA